MSNSFPQLDSVPAFEHMHKLEQCSFEYTELNYIVCFSVNGIII